MKKRRELKIGSNIFNSKSQALKYYREILNKYEPPIFVDDDDFQKLIDLI